MFEVDNHNILGIVPRHILAYCTDAKDNRVHPDSEKAVIGKIMFYAPEREDHPGIAYATFNWSVDQYDRQRFLAMLASIQDSVTLTRKAGFRDAQNQMRTALGLDDLDERKQHEFDED